MRDELLPEQVIRRVQHIVFRAAELDAARLAAPAGMNLRLDDPGLAADLARPLSRLLGAVGQRAAWHGHAELGEDFLGLILMNVHLVLLLRPLS